MSESHSVLSNILKRGRLTFPGNNTRYCSFKDSSSPSIFHDSGYNESLKDPSFDFTDAERKGERSERGQHEHSKYSHSGLCTSVLSPTKHENVNLSERRDASLHTTFSDTPKVAKKDLSLRRRLLVSKAASVGAVGCSERSAFLGSNQKKKSASHFLSFDERISKCALDSPRPASYKPLATSSLKTEDPSSCQKLRHVFSQQRTSTIDDSKSQSRWLLEPAYLSPIQPKPSDSFVVNTPNSFVDSGLTSFSNQSTYSGLVRTPQCILSETSVDEFVTPINRLIEGFHFNTSEINTSPAKAASDLDLLASDSSSCNSLSLDRSEDSLAGQEGSFQELLQKHNESPIFLNAERKVRIRKLQRSRRLSTLSERGSQSEKEEDTAITSANSKCQQKTVDSSINGDSKLVFNENDKHMVLHLGNLSRTPALQMIHEVFMQSRSKSIERNDLSRNIDGTDMSVLKCIVARLIGKKMGLEKLDILTELRDRDLKHVLGMILGITTVEGLCSMWKVSKNWREIVVQDKHANRRRRLYIKQLRTEAKGHMPPVEDAATRLMMARFALRPVQAQAKPALLQMEASCLEVLMPMGCSPLHQSDSKQETYVKVAKTLLSDEALKSCPRCQCPAKYQSLKKRGLCSREDCAFDFCISCLCAFHGSKDCYSSSSKWKNRKDALPGSAKSKRNLKRL